MTFQPLNYIQCIICVRVPVFKNAREVTLNITYARMINAFYKVKNYYFQEKISLKKVMKNRKLVSFHMNTIS